MQPGGSRGLSTDLKGKEKKESFAATLKKKFALKKGPRSQSVDRYQSSSLRETSLLRPPGQIDQQVLHIRYTDDPNSQYGEGRQVRSNSFGSSLKRIFKKDKKPISRDNSLNRTTGATLTVSGRGPQPEIIRDGSAEDHYGLPGSYGGDRSRRAGTPVPPGKDEYTTGDKRYGYGTSAPATKSALY
jgi:hypothetical protein